MSRGPLTALLAVLAVAGYQNRDKIAEVLRGIGQSVQNKQTGDAGASSGTGGLGDLFGNLTHGGGLGDLFGGSSSGGILSGGLGSLLEQFQRNGQGDKAESWIKTGENEPINDQELSQALGDDTLNELAAKTGLSKQEILSRLSRDLPKAVDELTPNGTVPTPKQAEDLTSPQRSSGPNTGGTFA
jgi:uncharacterized protein YidB (DUF937 family)